MASPASKLYDHSSSKKGREEPKPKAKDDGEKKPEGKKEPESKPAESKPADHPHKAVHERHHAEREGMHKRHRAEHRDLHGNHRSERDKMHERHAQEHEDLSGKQLGELQAGPAAGEGAPAPAMPGAAAPVPA